MVKVLRSFVRGPLEPYVVGFTELLCQQGYARSSASQHICFIAHLDRWMSASGVEVGQLSGPMIERYLAERRAAGIGSTGRRGRSPRCWLIWGRWRCCQHRRWFAAGRWKTCWAVTATT